MKSQWHIYRELELISERVIKPKESWFCWVLRQIQRSMARNFVRDLAHKHQILLFERCLKLGLQETPFVGCADTDSWPEPLQHPNALPPPTLDFNPLSQKRSWTARHNSAKGMEFDCLEF